MADMIAKLRAQPRGDEIAALHVDCQANAELFVILDTPDAETKQAAEAIVARARVASRDICQRCGDSGAEIMATTKGPVRKCRDCGTRDDTEISFEEAARILGTYKHALIRQMESGEFSGRERRLQLGNTSIHVRHVPKWLTILPGRPAGEVVRALSFVGQHEAARALQVIKARVPNRGLEPPRLSPLVPQTSASTNGNTCFPRLEGRREALG